MGEPCWRPFSLREVFPALCTSALFSSLLSDPARLRAGYGRSQRFIANYSRINQSNRWGLSLGIRFCVTGHLPGSFGWEMQPPREKAQGQPRNLGLVASPRGGALVGTERAQRKLSLRSLPGAQQAGTRCLRETFGASRDSAERREREGKRRSPGRGVST